MRKEHGYIAQISYLGAPCFLAQKLIHFREVGRRERLLGREDDVFAHKFIIRCVRHAESDGQPQRMSSVEAATVSSPAAVAVQCSIVYNSLIKPNQAIFHDSNPHGPPSASICVNLRADAFSYFSFLLSQFLISHDMPIQAYSSQNSRICALLSRFCGV